MLLALRLRVSEVLHYKRAQVALWRSAGSTIGLSSWSKTMNNFSVGLESEFGLKKHCFWQRFGEKLRSR